VALGDSATWIWNLSHRCFPGAVEIVDLRHARQHPWELAGQLFRRDPEAKMRCARKLQRQLDEGKVKKLVKGPRESRPAHEELARLVDNAIRYFEDNAERMRYPEFRAQGLFVGSGVIGAGCKMVAGARLKRSGMFWTAAGANAILAPRRHRFSGKIEDYWGNRALAA